MADVQTLQKKKKQKKHQQNVVKKVKVKNNRKTKRPGHVLDGLNSLLSGQL